MLSLLGHPKHPSRSDVAWDKLEKFAALITLGATAVSILEFIGIRVGNVSILTWANDTHEFFRAIVISFAGAALGITLSVATVLFSRIDYSNRFFGYLVAGGFAGLLIPINTYLFPSESPEPWPEIGFALGLITLLAAASSRLKAMRSTLISAHRQHATMLFCASIAGCFGFMMTALD